MDTKIILETMDSKFGALDRKIDQKFGLLDKKFDVMTEDLIDLKGKVNAVDEKIDVVYKKLSSEIALEVRDLGNSIRFSNEKVDEFLKSKVSYIEHNKLSERVSKIELKVA